MGQIQDNARSNHLMAEDLFDDSEMNGDTI